jgi:hypothetical protein
VERSPLLAHWRMTHFAAFAGATVEVRVPISQTLLDDVLAREVLPRVPALRRLEARILPDNRLELSVASARIAWLPTLTIPLAIEPEIAPGPRVRLQIVGGGIAAQVAPFAGRFGDGRVKGLRIHERNIEVDLIEFLRPPDDRTVERWFDGGSVSTQRGVLWLSARLALSDMPPSTR